MRANFPGITVVLALALLTSCTPPKKLDVRFGKLHTYTVGTAQSTYEYDTIGRISRITKVDLSTQPPTTVFTKTYEWSSASPPLTVTETTINVNPPSTTAADWKLNANGLADQKSVGTAITIFSYDPNAQVWKYSKEPTGYTVTRTVNSDGDVTQEVQTDGNGNPTGVGTNTVVPETSAPNYNDGRRFQGSLITHMPKSETPTMGDAFTYSYSFYPDGKVKEQTKSGSTSTVTTTFTYYPN